MRINIIAGSEISATTRCEMTPTGRLAAQAPAISGWPVAFLAVLRWAVSFIALVCAGFAHAWVALDVGHTLEKPGAASARGRTEFEFNRDLAQVLAHALLNQGVETSLINADGLIGSLSGRARAAQGAQLLVAIHHDSVQPQFLSPWIHDGAERLRSGERFRGFSLFVSRRSAVLRRGLHCASAIGAGLKRAGFAPSLYHAEPVPGEFKPFADKANGVHFFDNLVVLKEATMPALLLEAGVIVNGDEEEQLRDAMRMRLMADAVARSIRDCLPAN